MSQRYQQTSDPSYRYPQMGSQQNNPFGNFQQNTYNIQRQQHLHPYDQAYDPNVQMLEKVNSRNTGEIIHNNLKRNLLDENIVEYVINIDSYDRDITVFPDPFHYVCTFGAIAGGIIRREVPSSPTGRMGSTGMEIVEEYIRGTPMPYIRRKFNNVKYVRVDCATLPLYYNIKEDGGQWVLDQSDTLTHDRFTVMRIKELDSQLVLSTGTVTDGHGFILIPDTIPNGSNYYFAIPPKISSRIYEFKDSRLGNLERFTIDFTDSFGTSLRYTGLDSTVPITDVRNPKYKYTQNFISFTIGVVENEMGTDVKHSM